MTIYIGSARIDENGHASGGAAGDQKQKKTPDYTGEVSMQAMYKHKKGWYILRPKSEEHAKKLAVAMMSYCNDKNLGYDQNQRLGIMSYDGTKKTECDCSSLVRRCVKDATGIDPGNFTTDTELTVLAKTDLFFDKVAYVSQEKTPVYNGDILVTKTKGHTAIAVSGNERGTKIKYYPKYTGSGSSIVNALAAVGEKDTSKEHRKKIAAANHIEGYTGTAYENMALLTLIKVGKLIKA